jgi:hypothetical protein
MRRFKMKNQVEANNTASFREHILKTRRMFLSAAVFFIFTAGFFCSSLHAVNSLVINEIMGSNSKVTDEDGDAPDWIEIYNGTEKTIDLTGYGLSDKAEKLLRWEFPERQISPGEHLLVFASGKNKKTMSGPLHTNFKLSSRDKGVYLSDSNGNIIDQVIIDKFPRDISYGRHPETTNMVYFPLATPGKANTSAAFSPVVEYSVKGGLHSNPLTVSLFTEGNDSVIYYTKDGSTPTVASEIYSNPIKVDTNTTIRAVSLKKGHLVSPSSGQSYFIGFDNRGIAVLAVSAEQEKFWDDKTGLFREISYKDHMLRDSLRVHVSYYDENGNPGFSQDASMGVVGASSREIMMRPLKISASEQIDPMNGKFSYKLFANDIDEYRHFQIRNNNQDGIRYLIDPECMPTMGIRNALFCELVRGQEGIEIRDDNGPVLFFINGKNYGMMNIGEKRDNTGISENNPHVKAKDVDLLVVRNDMGIRVERHNLGEGAVFIRHDGQVVYKGYFEDGAVEYEEISESSKRGGSTRAVDDFIAMDATDSSQLDPKSFIASMAAHVIACNTDFGMNNIGFWRNAPVGEKPGPFRVYSFDFDAIFGLDKWKAEDYDTLIIYEEETKLFSHFLEKEEYKTAFIQKIDEYLNNVFTPEKANPIIDRLEKKMEPWIEHHLTMWADGQMDKTQWKKNVDNIRKFISARPKYVRMHVKDFFGLSGYNELTFSVSPGGKGEIYTDTGVFTTRLEGQGTYANIPMTISTRAARGYRFSHFIVNGSVVEGETYTFVPEDGMDIRAVFVEDRLSPVADVVINEVVRSGKHKIFDEDKEKQDWIELYNTTEHAIDLTGKYLSDNEEDLTKWQFPKLSIRPGGFIVIFASGKDRKDTSGNLHANFKLSLEPVIITDTDGKTIIDKVTLEETKNIPKKRSGIKYPDGAAVFLYSTVSTPGKSNIQGDPPEDRKYPMPSEDGRIIEKEAS